MKVRRPAEPTQKSSQASAIKKISEERYQPWVFALVPPLLTALIYIPLLRNGFVNWDDEKTILGNPHIRSLDLQTIQWMFTSARTDYWMPVMWLSFAVNYLLGGTDPKIYHFTDLFLHSLNTLLVFFISLRILEIGFENGDIKSRGKVAATRIPAAALTALLFGFHPLHVESVAWATERKDVLCAFFYLLALLLYLNYAFGGKQRNLFLCFCFFILALMSKPMAITLPMVLLILDLWPLRRLEIGFLKILKEKILFYIAAFLTGAVALLSPHPAVEAIGNPSLVFRLANSFRSVIFYMMKIVFPMRLSPLYPFPINQTEAYKIENCLAALAVLLLTAGLFWYRHKTPYLLIGWLYFLITLSPVLGIFQLGFHAAADRYTYLPSLGLLLPAAVVISALLAQRKQVFFLFCAGLALLLGFLTVQQIGVWENSETLWKTVLARYPEDSPAFVHENLGAVYQTQGRLGDALREYERAIALSPFSEPAHNGKGTIFFDMGRQQEAVQEFKLSISLEPLEAPPHRNLAIAYERMGMHEQALSEMQIAEKIKAENPE